MGLRCRKSFKIAPGVRVNINKKSVGISAGVKGARVSVNSKGRVTKTVGLPGTGISYTDVSTVGKKKTAQPDGSQQPIAPVEPVASAPSPSMTKANNAAAKSLKVLAPIFCIASAMLMLVYPLGGFIAYLFGVFLGSVPRTYQAQQQGTAPVSILKRKGVVIAAVIGFLWFLLCRTIPV